MRPLPHELRPDADRRSGPITVMIVDGFDLTIEGLHGMFSKEKNMEVVATAANKEEARRYTLGHKPDLALLGPNLTPDFADTTQPEVVKAIREVCKDTRIVLLTRSESEIPIVNESLAEGADGAIMLSSPREDMIGACYQVLEGSGYFTARLAKEMLRPSNHKSHSLSERELEVLAGIAFGYTNQEISDNLYLSVRTVESHRASIMEKMNLHTRAELVHYAIQLGLLQGDDPYWKRPPVEA